MLAKGFFAAVMLLCCGLVEADQYFYKPLSEVLTEKPDSGPVLEKDMYRGLTVTQKMICRDMMFPTAWGDGSAEAYIYSESKKDHFSYGNQDYWHDMSGLYLAVRSDDQQTVAGQVAIAKSDMSGKVLFPFKVEKSNDDQAEAQRLFKEAKAAYYKMLLNDGGPGVGWFRYQYSQAKDSGSGGNINANSRFGRGTDFDRSFSLFSGSQALSENLQFDRNLRVNGEGELSVDISTLSGITTQEINWKDIVKDMKVEKDPLAKLIPADQHAIFFPSFSAMVQVVEQADRYGTPLLGIAEPRSEDAKTKQRLEGQLCLELSALSKLLGPAVIKSIAYTGGDPYWRMGSDFAVLFDCSVPDAVELNIEKGRQEAIMADSSAKATSGEIGGVKYKALVSPSRTISSYSARVGQMVIVTNSMKQLEQIVKVSQGKLPAMSELDEYTFFRDRYKLNDKSESAFVILTDATIRRWCSPAWRIADSRRVRAATIMTQLQCQAMDKLVAGDKQAVLLAGKEVKELGDLTVNDNGFQSSVYGTLAFMTPISEMKIDTITQPEADAYNRFRTNYQNNWRQFFDPIAIRLSVADNSMSIDLTVMPLIAGSEYNEVMSVAGKNTFTADAGDRHAETLLHVIYAIDKDSQQVKQASALASIMVPALKENPLSWLGDSVSIYFDKDPYWQKLIDEYKKDGFRSTSSIADMPVGINLSVQDSFKLAGFLVAARAFIEQTAPGLTNWQTLSYNSQDYVKISPSQKQGAGLPQNLAIYYAITDGYLVLTLNEGLLKRAIDRNTSAVAPETGWQGESLAASGREDVVEMLQTFFHENLAVESQLQSWKNIIILNEWKKHYPDSDPIALQEKYWNVKLVCPGGGEYVWDEANRTMSSTVYGSPSCPKMPETSITVINNIKDFEMGLTFEKDGLRARGTIGYKQ